MLKRVVIALIAVAVLSGGLLAQEPGVFLPFYFIYDDAVTHTGGGDPNDRDVVFFEDHPMVSEKVKTFAGGFIMNIMRARYFSRFTVAPRRTYYVGVANAAPPGGDNFGMDPMTYEVSGTGFDKVDLVLRLGEGTGLLPPEGTVPIIISAGSPDVVISWDKAAYPSVDVYRQTGDGTGQYDKAYSPRWVKVSDADADGEYRDAGYIAADPKEAYYKALVNPEAPAVKIPLAWAVGKFDLALIAGKFNLVSTPVVPLHGTGIDNVFLGRTGGGLRHNGDEVYFFDENTRLNIKALYDNGTWKYFPNTPFSVNLGSGYWVYIPSGGPGRVTVLGAVIVTDSHRRLGIAGDRFSLMSSPIPTFYSELAAAGLPARGTDEIYLFRALTGLQDKMINRGGVWQNAVPPPAGTTFGLIPGAGYWYRNNDTARDWTLSP